MNIAAVSSLSDNTNFKAAHRVQGVVVNGKYYGQKNKLMLYDVSAALSKGLYQNKLSNEVRAQVYKFFKDYKDDPFFMVARSAEAIYQQKIMLLTSDDAHDYRNLCSAEDDPDVKNWALNRIFKRCRGQKLIISADQNKDGIYTITGIKQV